MGEMTGADIGDLERGAAQLESVGSRIGAMRNPLRSQLYSSHWHGGAADRFRSEWDSVHGPALSQAEDFLRGAGQRLRTEADQQRSASNMGGGGRGTSASASKGSSRGGFGGWIRDRVSDALPWVGASAGLAFGGLPGLVVGLAVSTGNSIPDTGRILWNTTLEVLYEGDSLSNRQRAFVRLAKQLPVPGGFLTLGGIISVPKLIYKAADFGIDTVRYGPSSDVVRAERSGLIKDGLDFSTKLFPDPIEIGASGTDLVTGSDYGSRTEPSYWINDPLRRMSDYEGSVQ